MKSLFFCQYAKRQKTLSKNPIYIKSSKDSVSLTYFERYARGVDRADTVFIVLSLKGKNQRNFKKTTIEKRQKGPEKSKERKNELVHFYALYSFPVTAPAVPKPKQKSALAMPFAL